jgi:hypothetical protein
MLTGNIYSHPKFKINDQVKFLLDKERDRLFYFFDIEKKTWFKTCQDSKAVWGKGKITNIEDEWIYVFTHDIFNPFSWPVIIKFPNWKHENYLSGMYDVWNGFLEIIEDEKEIIKCECGCNKIYGKNNTFHSFWCPLYCGINKKENNSF